MSLTIATLCGSLRKESYNRKLLRAAVAAAPPGVTFTQLEIGEVPHYNGDLDGDTKPPGAQALIHGIASAQALLIVTPEYNYGVPGVLKNAIDWASRPAYRSPLALKPTALMSAASSQVGGARAQAQLRQVLGGTLTPLYPHPDLAVGKVADKLDAAGNLTDEDTLQRLERFMAGFVAWAQRQLG